MAVAADGDEAAAAGRFVAAGLAAAVADSAPLDSGKIMRAESTAAGCCSPDADATAGVVCACLWCGDEWSGRRISEDEEESDGAEESDAAAATAGVAER